MPMIEVSPHRCRVWSLHPRLEENLTEESCRTEIESFEKHGQLIPVLGRPLRGHPDFDVELIYGARRLFVARHLNRPLIVELRDISDRDGIVAMDLENRLRKDVSPYERALSYERWLREGYFAAQGEIANALQVSHAQISRLLKLARLPALVIQAFSNATDVCEAWGERLAILLKDADAERHVLAAARSIAALSPRPSAEAIFESLCAAADAPRTSRALERVVTDEDGAELFRVKHQQDTVVFNVLLEMLSAELLEEMERALVRAADSQTEQLTCQM